MNMDRVNNMFKYAFFTSIILISAAMHYSKFSKDLSGTHVWRQSQTQSTILSFYEEDFNILNPRRTDRGSGDGIYRMEFPLMQWLIASIYKVFGNHLIITRIFTFIVGLFSVAGLYKLLSALFQKDILALIGAWAFNFSPCFYYYTINPMPDNYALCFSIWGLALFFSWIRNKRQILLIFSGLFLCVGTLCKLPFILYYSVPLTYFLVEFFQQKEGRKIILRDAFTATSFIVIPLIWYASVVSTWKGNGIVSGLLDNKTPLKETFGYFRYIFLSTLPGMLLNYGSVIFFLAGFYFLFKNKRYKNRRFMLLFVLSIAVSAYYFFEINLIQGGHDYYLFPFYPPLFIIVGYGAYYLLHTRKRFAIFTVFVLLFLLPVIAHLKIWNPWVPERPGFNKDLITYKDDLRNAAPKGALCIAGNDISSSIFFYYINKKGWAFNNNLTKQKMSEMIDNGAKYLYSDSRDVHENKEFTPLLDSLVMERGSIKVFRLKKDAE
jgi:hypothetical protein